MVFVALIAMEDSSCTFGKWFVALPYGLLLELPPEFLLFSPRALRRRPQPPHLLR
jgi:hypothetical protein